jgi:hypothetical protein
MAKKAKKRTPVRYSKDDIKALKAHSRARTPLKNIANRAFFLSVCPKSS